MGREWTKRRTKRARAIASLLSIGRCETLLASSALSASRVAIFRKRLAELSCRLGADDEDWAGRGRNSAEPIAWLRNTRDGAHDITLFPYALPRLLCCLNYQGLAWISREHRCANYQRDRRDGALPHPTSQARKPARRIHTRKVTESPAAGNSQSGATVVTSDVRL